jgi:hypothetical protein
MPGDSKARPTDGGVWHSKPGWQWAGFLLINGVILAVLFWPAMTGQKMLAPLDIAPNFFSKFRYVDPEATGVPANHYIVDLILGDVSRNLLVHEAWQRREMPWWDPHIEGGKPLAAEANAVNISDPFKVILFHLLPFEIAYNWIRIVPFFVSGLLAFGLLRHFGFSFVPALWGGSLYEFAGCNAMMFAGPTVQASFVYYPLLWLLWDRGIREHKISWFLGSGLVTALIFLSGNLQSHTYPFLFALAFLVGYGWRHRERWRLLLFGSGASLAMGLCLAAPFLFSQVELFFLSTREVQPEFIPRHMLSGVASLAAFFPWLLGTFRTLDLSKFFGQTGLGFWPYIGSAALIIAVLGGGLRLGDGSREADLKRTALALVTTYLVVCSTPLLAVLYTRTAWLAVLGIVVMLAFGYRRLAEVTTPLRRWGWTVILMTAVIAAAMNMGGLVFYPRVQPKVEARFLEQQRSNPSLDEATALRRFQVANLANEVTFRNREVLLAAAGMLALGIWLLRPVKPKLCINAILVLSTLPLLWFTHRFIPMQPMALWNRIRAGGPEQLRVAETMKPSGQRLLETAPGRNELVFPGAMGQLFGMHVLHGHSSLILKNAGLLGPTTDKRGPPFFDYEYRSERRGMERGEFLKTTESPTARFHWNSPNERKIAIESETLTTLTLAISPGTDGELIRTDTYYPGWRIETPADASMQFEPPCFTRIHVPGATTRVKLKYEPRWLQPGIYVAASSLLLLGVAFVGTTRRARLRAR